MVQTVLFVLAIVLAVCQGKVILKEDNLLNPLVNVIPKKNIETDSNIRIDLPTATPFDAQSENNEPIGKFETDNEIEDNYNNDKIVVNDPLESALNGSEPLILTPMLEKGLNEEARNACRVDPSLFLGFESYSGFFTVNKTYNSNEFFWYFPVENKPVNETPWIIWLQGGPGASSLVGLFEEIGPFQEYEESLIRNPYTWLQNHSLLFIDNPIGAGFSFTEHDEGFVTDMATYSNHLFSTVQQFLQVFPELRMAPLFIAGESYAGKYVPALGMELHKHKHKPGQNVNLQGLIVGNAYIDPAMIAQVTQPFYYFGLLEREQIQSIEPLVKAFQRDIANNDSVQAKNKWVRLVSVLLFLTHQKQAYNFLKDELPLGLFFGFLERPEIKKALHVGEINYSFVNYTTNTRLAPDFLRSSKSLFEELLDHYRVLAYCGQLDQMLPCVFTSENYRTWQWSGASEFLRAVRYPFIFNGTLAGYSKAGGRLTEVVIRGAGHMVPADVPAPAQALVARWTKNERLASSYPLLEGTFIEEFIANSSSIVYL